MKKLLLICLASLYGGTLTAQPASANDATPPEYTCLHTVTPIALDGDIYGAEWAAAPWTADFVDIQGPDGNNTPRFRTRAKLLWDNKYLYIAAEMEEPHIWGTLTQRESVIFHDNDFEVFLDPTNTTHHYMEYEVNALGTEWDLMLTKPYSEGGKPLNCWDIHGVRNAIKYYGTCNNPRDTDQKWTIEIAMPLASLTEVLGTNYRIADGSVWRLNFSRVEWLVDIVDGNYVKRPKTPEDNWVWAPTGKINIHIPSQWGYLRFSTKTK